MGTNSRSLESLVEQIDSGALKLPEIQRDFVWGRPNVLLLFDSLYRRLPIGFMLVWKAKTTVGTKKFKGREMAGQSVESFYGYLLDGQQRLSAIRRVRDRDEYYPLMFRLWPDDEEKPDENRFCYRTKRNSQSPWYVPVADVIGKQVTPYQLVEKLKEEADDFSPDTDADRVLAGLSRLQDIMSYDVGVIEYEDDHYRNATELFIRFNSTGKKLKGTDLVSAQLALSVPELVSQGVNAACTKYHGFRFSSTFLVQCLAAVHTSRMNLKKPEEVWAGSDKKSITDSWKRTERGLGRAVELLTGTVKWDSDAWLPSFNSIIPLVYLLSIDKFNLREKKMARSWLLGANIHKIFSGTVHTKLDKILRGLEREPSLDKLAKLTKKDIGKVQPDHLDTRRKSGAAMSLYISMLRNTNAKDWKSETALDGSVIGHNAQLQVHHFFPQALLASNGYESEDINSFANYTIINKETNLKISDEALCANVAETLPLC